MMKRLFFAMVFTMVAGLAHAGPARDANGNRGFTVRHHHYGLICGWTQMRHFGITNNRYRMARAWTDFARTSPAPEVVVVQSRKGHASDGSPGGHVSRIVRVTGACSAIVTDERGTYERDICSRLIAYVDPHRGGERTMRSSRHHHQQALAQYGGPGSASYY